MKMSNVDKAILITLIGGALLTSPFAGQFVYRAAKRLLKKWWDEGGPYVPPEQDPAQVRDSLYRLKRNKYIEWKLDKKKSFVKLELTGKGRKFFAEQKFADTKIPSQEKWDGRWRFFMFDIPEKSRSFRNALRAKLKDLGFFQIQKSVWVYPFECEKEMAYIGEFLGIRHFTLMFTAKIEKDTILRKHFIHKNILSRSHLRAKVI